MLTTNNKLTLKNLAYDVLDGQLNLSALVVRLVADLKSTDSISVICNFKLSNGERGSLGERFPLDPKNPKDILEYIDYLNVKHSQLNNRYKIVPIVTVFFGYSHVSQDYYLQRKSILNSQTVAIEKLNNLNLKDELPVNLPLNTNYSTWGITAEWIEESVQRVSNLTVDSGTNISRYVQVNYLDKINRSIEVFSSKSSLKTQMFTDKIINIFSGDFIRQVGDTYYHIKNNNVHFIFEKLFCSSEKITKANIASKHTLNLLTLDVETFLNEDNQMVLFCVSFYDGTTSHTFYRSDYNTLNDMMSALLSKLLSRGLSQKTVYIHNSSDFDLVFLLKYLVNRKGVIVEPIIKDGSFINLKIKYGPKYSYYLNFKDSYLLLPSSLAGLGKTFNVETTKDIFPYSFPNENNLNYVGPVPGYEFFDQTKVSLSEYNQYCTRFTQGTWSLKNETIKYCEKDCIALYQVIETFSNLIFEQFKINISSVSTLPSLAFKIFRSQFLPKSTQLPVLSGKVYDAISQAYYGGHVDMYVPSNPEGELVYHYDVNALYPSGMKNFLYPSKIIGHFRGDITKIADYVKLYQDNLSVLKVKVIAPKDLANPILPFKINGTTVYPEGSWTGWYYSEELNNATKYGYQFEILEGYLFKGSDLFSKYVDVMNQMKEESSKDSPWYTISKLLLNSLYGRFGMKPRMISHEVVENNQISSFVSGIGLENLIDQTEMGNKTLISYWVEFSRLPKINIAIASAISANARVIMSAFKNHPDYILYYSDTDSYFLNKPLPGHLVDNKKLGLFKLEAVLTKFVALGPKVYGGIDSNGAEFTKVKGLKTPVTVQQLEGLLIKNNSLNLEQTKWFNHLSDSTISVKDSAYNLKPTDAKRNLVYNNGRLVGTSNIVVVSEGGSI